MPTQRWGLFLHFKPCPGQARWVAALSSPEAAQKAPGPQGCLQLLGAPKRWNNRTAGWQIQAAGSQA